MKKYISDEKSYAYVCLIIDSFEGDKGLGLGSQFSQLIALSFTNDMDHMIKEKLHIKHYLRYMDDFILIDYSKEKLQAARVEIEKLLKEKGLELNPKTSLFPFKNGIKFLQWKFIYKNDKLLMLIDHKKSVKQKKKLKKIVNKEMTEEFKKGTAQYSFDCWSAHAKKGNTYRYRKDVENYLDSLLNNQECY